MPPKGKKTRVNPQGKKQGVTEAIDVAAKTLITKTDGKGRRKRKSTAMDSLGDVLPGPAEKKPKMQEDELADPELHFSVSSNSSDQYWLQDSGEEDDSEAEEGDLDENGKDRMHKPIMDESKRELGDGKVEIWDSVTGNVITYQGKQTRKEWVEKMQEVHAAQESKDKRKKRFEEHEERCDRVYVDHQHIADLGDDELDDILSEDHSGNFVLVPDVEGDIERVGAGIYRTIGKNGKVEGYLKRRGRTGRGSDGKITIPVKSMSGREKEKLREKIKEDEEEEEEDGDYVDDGEAEEDEDGEEHEESVVDEEEHEESVVDEEEHEEPEYEESGEEDGDEEMSGV